MKKTEVIDSLRSLHDLSKAINSTLDVDEVVEQILNMTSALMKSGKVIILLLERKEKVLSLYRSIGLDEGEDSFKDIRNVRSFDHCIVRKGRVIEASELVAPGEYEGLLAETPLLSKMVFAPLEIKGRAYGLLGVENGNKNFSRVELEIFCSLGSQSAVAIENANLYKSLKESFLHTAEALAEAINSRDPYTGGHTRRVMEYALKIAASLHLSERELESLKFAAVLHDIGKIGIDDAILRKGGDLSESEDMEMRKHPEIGARILAHVEGMGGVIAGVRHHHERYDGGGYPDGLAGEAIHIYARIISVADAFDALTTNRPYRKGISRTAACKELLKSSGTQFDPELVEILCNSTMDG